jgi:hypothetical protein
VAHNIRLRHDSGSEMHFLKLQPRQRQLQSMIARRRPPLSGCGKCRAFEHAPNGLQRSLFG